jgi:hypothetical protein
MGHDHEGQRVSRRRILAGVSSIGLTGLLSACTGSSPVTTSTGAVITPQATTETDLTDLFTDTNTCALTPSRSSRTSLRTLSASRSGTVTPPGSTPARKRNRPEAGRDHLPQDERLPGSHSKEVRHRQAAEDRPQGTEPPTSNRPTTSATCEAHR